MIIRGAAVLRKESSVAGSGLSSNFQTGRFDEIHRVKIAREPLIPGRLSIGGIGQMEMSSRGRPARSSD